MTFFDWVQRRELGLQTIGDEDFIHKFVYNSFKPYQTWSSGTDRRPDYGAVFNLEFSPEGNLLVAACEKKAILLFDPITTKRIKTICNAHTDSVNCIKFLDNRQFATCSDDTTVALWDTRNLKQKIRSLHGHSNWVKNIEYSQKDGLLVTSGFDGSIYTWDTNSLTEQGFVYQKVFHTSGLMRCRITPDASKLVISTTGGYLIIIHDLDLTTLAKDLCGFRPNIYRLMQLGRQFIPQAAKFDHVFSKSQKRNRVELVSDFPEHNDAEVLCALQIHPHGLCALSRNISYDEGSEWTCIHDIQEKDEEHEYKKKRKHSEIEDPPNNESRENISSSSSTNFEPSRNVASTSNSVSGSTDSNRNESFVPDIWAAEITVKDRACRIIRGPRTSNNGNSAYAYVYAISSGVLATPTNRNSSTDWNWTPPREEARDKAIYMSIYDRQINQNVRRLMYYIEEPNRGKGFIKEPSFSSDGRLICSPYGFGVRLLSFNDELTDFSKAISLSGELPQVLKEFKQINCHSDIVVSTKFSHRYPLLVTGCLKGKITWHQTEFSN